MSRQINRLVLQINRIVFKSDRLVLRIDRRVSPPDRLVLRIDRRVFPSDRLSVLSGHITPAKPLLTSICGVSANFIFGTATFQNGTDTVYGISTDTLKNRSAAFVGECHAASVKLSLPQIV